jgi:thiamine biosynthesis protein ThiS
VRLLLARAMSLDGSLAVRVNGEHRRVPGGVSIAEMLNEIGIDPRKVAVERNLEIVPRSTLGEVCVEDGDDYEIVHFVGGG